VWGGGQAHLADDAGEQAGADVERLPGQTQLGLTMIRANAFEA
jgi:hypothetical protein